MTITTVQIKVTIIHWPWAWRPGFPSRWKYAQTPMAYRLQQTVSYWWVDANRM